MNRLSTYFAKLEYIDHNGPHYQGDLLHLGKANCPVPQVKGMCEMTLTYVLPTTPRRPFAKGDFVDVMDREGARLSTQQVVLIDGHWVVTCCGRMWTQKGYWVGDTGTWPFPWIKHSRRKSLVTEARCEPK